MFGSPSTLRLLLGSLNSFNVQNHSICSNYSLCPVEPMATNHMPENHPKQNHHSFSPTPTHLQHPPFFASLSRHPQKSQPSFRLSTKRPSDLKRPLTPRLESKRGQSASTFREGFHQTCFRKSLFSPFTFGGFKEEGVRSALRKIWEVRFGLEISRVFLSVSLTE